MFLFCLVFAMFCASLFICALWLPAGKGLTSWLSFVVSSVSLSLSHWYPGSDVVLDCIDSWSLHHYLLLNFWTQKSWGDRKLLKHRLTLVHYSAHTWATIHFNITRAWPEEIEIEKWLLRISVQCMLIKFHENHGPVTYFLTCCKHMVLIHPKEVKINND